jgi:hypothetical protein
MLKGLKRDLHFIEFLFVLEFVKSQRNCSPLGDFLDWDSLSLAIMWWIYSIQL